jgi:hypothetical protein
VAATAGHPDQSRQAAQAALALYQAKGNRPGADRAEAFREHLGELGRTGSPA